MEPIPSGGGGHKMKEKLSLVLFTLLAQAGIGLAVATQLLGAEGSMAATAFLGAVLLTAAGLMVASAHLGSPLRAYRALFNLRTSWLSRECLALALFLALGAARFLLAREGGPAGSSAWVGGLMVLAGGSSLFSMASLYGKTAIPASILEKPGPLDADEWEFIRRHTLIGERIIAAAPALAHIAPIVRSTHERQDGFGYPDGLTADAIPLGARIVAVVDAFDAMVTSRSYKPAVSAAEALAELRRCAGTQFDRVVVDAFASVIERQWAAARAA